MKYIFIIGLLYSSLSLSAQIDSTYIEKIPNTKMISLHSSLRLFQLSFSTQRQAPVYFQNYNLGIGTRFKYKQLGASVSIPIATFQDYNLGKSKIYGLGFGLYPKHFFVQADMRYIQGLSDFESETFRADMRAFYGGLFTVYLFNTKRFSLRSAFKMIDRQKRSAGSFFVSNLLEYQELQTDSLTLILGVQDFDLQKYQAYKIGLGGGYAYTLVLKEWAITSMLSGGPEFRKLSYINEANRNNRNVFRISPRLRLFASAIYNSERFFYGVTGNYLPGLDRTDELNTRVKNWSLRFHIGWRLH